MALTPQERERVRYHLGYLNTSLAGSIQYGLPRPMQTLFVVEQAMDYVNHIIKERNAGFLLFNTWIKDSLLSETVAFFEDLLSDNNPEAQRIESYSVDDKTPNTPALSGQGIWIIKSVVRMLPTLDVIVCQSEVSPDAITVTAS